MSRDNKAQKSTYSDPKTGYTTRILTMTSNIATSRWHVIN